MEGCRKSLNCAFREFNNCRALHEATWADLVEVSLQHTELKRKADDADEKTLSHSERPRRATCGVPDRESNETDDQRLAVSLLSTVL